MKSTRLMVAMTLLASVLNAPAIAHDISKGDLTIDHPEVRMTLPSRPAAAYMTIFNAGSADDRLLSATSSAYRAVEIHLSSMKDGVMRMEKIDTIDVPAAGKAVLEPGGLHLMLFGADTDAIAEGIAPMTLTFEKAGDVDIVLIVVQPSRKNDDADHSGHGDHGGHSDHSSDAAHDGHSGHGTKKKHNHGSATQ